MNALPLKFLGLSVLLLLHCFSIKIDLDQYLTTFNLFSDSMEKQFFLKSPTSSLIGEGCFTTIDVPAADGAEPTGIFQTALKSAFDSAKKAGIENPIVVGTIPFDPTEKSALYIPQSWKPLDGDNIANITNNAPDQHTSFNIKHSSGVSRETYTRIVATAVSNIRAGKLDKVVLSRTQTLKSEQPISSQALVSRLIAQNPNGYNFHLPLPDGSRLSGSSPELLVRKQDKYFESQPLAGSSARSKNTDEDREAQKALLCSKKDLHEHKLVVDWMRDVLKPVSSDLDAPSVPGTISTPKLWHLATKISGTVDEDTETSLTLAARLHPTPALSGFPHEAARDLLTQLEPFDRKYFGGIVGYTDSEGNGEWFIAIRCCQLMDKEVQLFAGAGIVADSVPESEWNETAVKLTTMQSAFT